MSDMADLAEIARLTAENAELRAGHWVMTEAEYAACNTARADLRSLRAVVATMKIAFDDCNDVDWRTVESHDYAEARDEALDAVCALVPLDGSWETEQ